MVERLHCDSVLSTKLSAPWLLHIAWDRLYSHCLPLSVAFLLTVLIVTFNYGHGYGAHTTFHRMHFELIIVFNFSLYI